MVGAARSTSVLIAGASATVAFVVLRTFVAMGGHEPLAVDVWWHDLVVSSTGDAWLVVAWVPAIVGGTLGMIVIGAALIAWLVWRKRRWDAATLAIALVAVVAIGATMAAVIGRTRPEDSLAESVATSFPSGHTAVATTVAVILALTFRRWYVWALGAVWVVTMMWSRTYLHAHWLSDVVAGLLEGIAVACFVWVCVDSARARHVSRATTESAGESAGEKTIESSATP
ncbi:phosphatase PAP2 family protein [Microbacterium phyllosphaerae]|uniref:phosphatase PAP2 family protein n=1 Tax=Microbacterium phyllosphaerae TaxID=124798 RepID=UPI003D6584F9